ncbi:MAG: hypothetical protein RLZZ53_3493, partial [Acidobacteriota bacterium]
ADFNNTERMQELFFTSTNATEL